MPERDGAAVHVRLVPVESKILLDREVLGRECFVDLDEVHVADREARAAQRLTRRGCGTDAHDVGIDAAHAA